MANKIRYGLSNVYYAVATLGTNNSATYATPVALPGAVSLSLDAEGETSNFYADNIAYYVTNSNNGYSGSLGTNCHEQCHADWSQSDSVLVCGSSRCQHVFCIPILYSA